MKLLRETIEHNDETQMQRGWEGWITDHTYFCDTTPPAPCHLEAYLNSTYSAYLRSKTDDGELLRACPASEKLLQAMDAASVTSDLAVAETDVVRFSINRSLHMLMGACRSRLLLLAGRWDKMGRHCGLGIRVHRPSSIGTREGISV